MIYSRDINSIRRGFTEKRGDGCRSIKQYQSLRNPEHWIKDAESTGQRSLYNTHDPASNVPVVRGSLKGHARPARESSPTQRLARRHLEQPRGAVCAHGDLGVEATMRGADTKRTRDACGEGSTGP